MKGYLYSSKIYKKYIGSYLLILFIPILLGSLIYYSSIDIVEKDIKERNLIAQNRVKDLLEQHIANAENITIQLAHNHKIDYLLKFKNGLSKKDVYKVKEAQKEISDYIVVDDVIDNIYIWYKNIDVVIDLNTSYIFAKHKYKDFFQIQNGMNHNQSIFDDKRYTHKVFPFVELKNDISLKKLIPIVQTMPYNVPSLSSGFIMITLKQTMINDYLNQTLLDGTGWAYIIDDQDQVITGISGNDGGIRVMELKDNNNTFDTVVDNNDMIVTYTTGSNGWKYVSVIPKATLYTKVKYIQNITVTMVIIIILLGLAVSIYFTNSKVRPLEGVIRSLKSENILVKNYPSVLEQIKDNIEQLKYNNEEMQDKLNQQKPYIEMNFFRQLYLGSYSSTEDINEVLDQLKINIQGKLYAVILLKITVKEIEAQSKPYDILNYNKVLVREMFNQTFGDNVFIYDNEINELVCLITNDTNDKTKFTNYLNDFMKQLYTTIQENDNSVHISSVAGKLRTNLIELNKAFYECRLLLSWQIIPNKDEYIVWYDTGLLFEYEKYYYPLEMQMHIINMAKSGEYENINKHLDELYKTNFIENNLSCNVYRRLLFDLQSTLYRTINQMNVDQYNQLSEVTRAITEITSYNDTKIIFNEIKDIFKELCNIVKKNKTSHNEQLMMRIRSFIKSNYDNPEISLGSLAHEFSLTEAYLSQFIKENQGVSFKNYLLMLRMEKANQYFSENKEKLTINDIAIKVGYYSTGTFRRAYKRKFGITPSQFIKKVETENK